MLVSNEHLCSLEWWHKFVVALPSSCAVLVRNKCVEVSVGERFIAAAGSQDFTAFIRGCLNPSHLLPSVQGASSAICAFEYPSRTLHGFFCIEVASLLDSHQLRAREAYMMEVLR